MTLKKRKSKTCSTVPEKTVQAGMDRGSRLGRHGVGDCCESFTSAIRNQIVSLSCSAYDLRGKPLLAYRRRLRKKGK